MRLTKRQLKRIIREEYSRLKRQGLIMEGPSEDEKKAAAGEGYMAAIRGDNPGSCPHEKDSDLYKLWMGAFQAAQDFR